MTMVRPLTSFGGAMQALVQVGFTTAHSIQARGGRRTLGFATLAVGVPVVAEYIAINVTHVLRHRTQPQVLGVPLNAALGWYNVTYATMSMLEGLLTHVGMSARSQRWMIPASTAIVATSFDLLLDCVGLEQGLWEWNIDGPYAAEIVGPNGKRGIPLLNFSGWLVLGSTVPFVYRLFAPDDTADAARAGRAGSIEATRMAVVLLLPYYGVGAAWAVYQRKPRYLLYSAVAPVTLVAALWSTRR